MQYSGRRSVNSETWEHSVFCSVSAFSEGAVASLLLHRLFIAVGKCTQC